MPPIGNSDSATEREELISGALEVMTVKRVYGEPYEKDGLTVIPAAIVGGLGGSATDGKKGKPGREGGFGLMARPSGAWIIDDGQVTWKPAIDVNRVVLGGQIIAFTAIFMTGRILLARAQRGGSRHAGRYQPLWSMARRLLLP